MIKNKVLGDGIIDDKTMIMERVIALVADLPHQSKLREELTNNFLNELWNTLDHPPLLYVGDQYRFRMADGSFNVCLARLYPTLERANTKQAALEPHPSPARRRWIGVRSFSPTRKDHYGSSSRPRADL